MRVWAMAAAFLLSIGVVPAAAQGWDFGIKGGPSFATVDIEDDEPTGRRVAGTWGAFVVLPMQPVLSVQIEALFGPRGAKVESGMEGITAALVIDYFNLPVLARVDWPLAGGHGIHAFAGPYAGLRTKARAELSTVLGSFTSGEDADISDQIRRLDAGLVAGLGVEIRRRVVIDGRYGWGLVNVSRPDDAPGLKHRFFSVMAGLRF